MKFLAVGITIILIVLLNIYLFRGINGLIDKKKNKKLFSNSFLGLDYPTAIADYCRCGTANRIFQRCVKKYYPNLYHI